jgi:hypothetical protein
MLLRVSLIVAVCGVAPSAQDLVTNRMSAATLRGVVVEVTCFREMGAATVAAADQIACAKKRAAEGGRLGILTEGDGVFQFTGAYAANKFAKLAPFIGQRVEASGAEVAISNNYDYRSFDLEKIARVKAER